MFLLPSDEACDCLVTRIDQAKLESDENKQSINVSGFAVSQIHNPHYSAFAKYESATRSKGIGFIITRGRE